jgi:hypothetical protein
MTAVLLCVGCGDAKLDTSSDKAFSESLEKVYNTVPEAEREDFRRYLNIVLENKAIRNAPDYEEISQLYSLIKAFGGKDEMLGRINGLTKTEIVTQGKVILKKSLEERLATLNEQIAEAQKKVDEGKRLQAESEKVEVICTGVDFKEGVEIWGNKPWGSIASFAALITVKNNSSETVKDIRGKISLTDGEPDSFSPNDLSSLKPVDLPDDAYYPGSLDIAPGTEWKGKVAWSMMGPNKRHPYPPTKEYTVTISDVKVELDVERQWGDDIETQEKMLAQSQQALKSVEAELAKIK